MSETFSGQVDIQDDSARTTIRLDGNGAGLSLGVDGKDGNLTLKNRDGDLRIRLDATNRPQTTERVYLVGEVGQIVAGGNGVSGVIEIKNAAGESSISLQGTGEARFGRMSLDPTDPTEATIVMSANSKRIELKSDDGINSRLTLDGARGDINVGDNDVSGSLKLYHPGTVSGNTAWPAILLEADDSTIKLRDGRDRDRILLDGGTGDIRAGATIHLKASGSIAPNSAETNIMLDGETASISVGGRENGNLTLKTRTDEVRIRLDASGGQQTTERIFIDGDRADIVVGGNNGSGTVDIKNANGGSLISLNGETGNGRFDNMDLVPAGQAEATISMSSRSKQVRIKSNSGDQRLTLDGERGDIDVGGNGVGGDISLFNSVSPSLEINRGATYATVHLNGQEANARLGGNGRGGDVALFKPNSQPSDVGDFNNATVHLGGSNGSARLGGNGVDGDVILFKSGSTSADVAVGSSEATVHLNGEGGNIRLGGNGTNGDVALFNSSSSSSDVDDFNQATIHFDGLRGNARLGGNGQGGDVALFNSISPSSDVGDFDRATIHLDGQRANLRLGGNGSDGDMALFRSGSSPSDVENFSNATIRLDGENGNLLLGGDGRDGEILIFPSSAADHSDWGQAVIRIDGGTGDIRLSGADCAENFDVVDAAAVNAGEVLVVGHLGALEPCREAYDKRVAGVVSGAGSYRPGLILDACAGQAGRVAVALMGKVFCKVDATAHPIDVGDLLTTSNTPGHAMKATDAAKAFGAVIGKAMRAQPSGTGMIPILVCLQ